MKVYIVFGNYFDGCKNWEHVNSVHGTEESAEITRLMLDEDPRKKPGISYHIVMYNVENIKL